MEHHSAHPMPAPPAQPKIRSFTGSWQRAQASQGCPPTLLAKLLVLNISQAGGEPGLGKERLVACQYPHP